LKAKRYAELSVGFDRHPTQQKQTRYQSDCLDQDLPSEKRAE